MPTFDEMHRAAEAEASPVRSEIATHRQAIASLEGGLAKIATRLRTDIKLALQWAHDDLKAAKLRLKWTRADFVQAVKTFEERWGKF